MKVFLVDFENVHEDGLDGISSLTAEDKVIVFHGPKKELVNLSIVESIVKSKADFDFIGTKRTADNYLDFQLSTYLGYLINQHPNAEFCIVSKDTDYDATIDFWKDNKKLKVNRQSNISGKVKIAIPVNPTESKSTESKAVTEEKKDESEKIKPTHVAAEMKNELAGILQSYNLSKNKLNLIVKIIIKSTNRTELHQNLINTFKDQNNINEIYKEIRKKHLQLRQKYLQ